MSVHYDTHDIIYALATAWASSALAVIRVSGEGCRAALSTAFSRPKALREAKNATLLHGWLSDEQGRRIDEVVLAINEKGSGYTHEEAVEISCHGSLAVIRSILALLASLGMRSAEAGEFSYRAFINGRIDLTQAEAVQALISSSSERSRALSLAHLEGRLKERIEELKGELLRVMAAVEVQLDYAEDELDEFVFPLQSLDSVLQGVGELADTYEAGRLYHSGAKVVLAGSTNVGKSSLFNLLLKEERSIVSPTSGTTRDYIEADLQVAGIPIRLYDTAGLRKSEDAIEREGMSRTERLIDRADLIIHLVDSTDLKEIPQEDERTIVVYNKSDLAQVDGTKRAISAQTGEGVRELLEAVAQRLTSSLPSLDDDALIIEGERQWRLLSVCREALGRARALALDDVALDIVAVDLFEALDGLGQLTGAVSSAEVLEAIFSGFCVGK